MALSVLNRLQDENKTLDTIMEEAYASDVLHDKREKALLQALVFGVLRWQGRLDWIIAQFSKSPLQRIEPEILNILRLGLFQIIYLSKIPVSAAVNTSVEMAKSTAPLWVVKFVNGVLRNAVRKHETLEFPDLHTDPVTALSATKSFPRWLILRWLKRYGLEETEQLCDAINKIPPLTIRTNTIKATREELIKSLETGVEQPQPTRFSPDGITFSHPGVAIPDLPSFRQGWFQVQDEAAQLVTLMLNPQAEDTVLDACAGLGGKTGHIAQLMKNRGRIVAMDNDSHKLERLKAEMQRLGVENTTVRCHDLTRPISDEYHALFDRILVDAPCSGLGVLRRNPDIKWRLSKKNFRNYQKRQIQFMDHLAPCIKPSGIIVYSVCSTESEENEDVINAFLTTHSKFIIDKELAYLPSQIHSLVNEKGYMKTQPHAHHMDGFFAVVFKRNS